MTLNWVRDHEHLALHVARPVGFCSISSWTPSVAFTSSVPLSCIVWSAMERRPISSPNLLPNQNFCRKESKTFSKNMSLWWRLSFMLPTSWWGLVVSNVTKLLKATCNASGNGIKEMVAKFCSMLPGRIDQVASFLFKTAEQLVCFLAENTLAADPEI